MKNLFLTIGLTVLSVSSFASSFASSIDVVRLTHDGICIPASCGGENVQIQGANVNDLGIGEKVSYLADVGIMVSGKGRGATFFSTCPNGVQNAKGDIGVYIEVMNEDLKAAQCRLVMTIKKYEEPRPIDGEKELENDWSHLPDGYFDGITTD